MTPLSLEPARTAVLSMDLQAGVVSVYVKDGGFMARAARVLACARRAGMRVVHVKVELRPQVPEASPRNLFLSAVKASPRHQQFFAGDSGAIRAEVAPAGGDLVVRKSRVSAFAGTDLDLLLRANDVETVVLFGIVTSGVVLATALHAFDADYRVVVVKDCCADSDVEVHACLVDRLLPRIAAVMTAEEFERICAPA